MSAKKIIVAVLIIIVAIGGFAAGLVLLRERQELREEASVPGGQAQVYITPESGSYQVGDTIQTSIYFNPANVAVAGVAVRLAYPFSGSSPEVSVDEINVNPAFLASGDWSCPTQDFSQKGGEVVIDVACANTSASGFRTTTNTLLADVTMKVNSVPSQNPVVVDFDPADSVIRTLSDNKDILLIPSSVGSYTVEGGGEAELTTSPTIEPTVTASPSTTSSPTPTTKVTNTPTPTKTVTGTVTQTPTGTVSLPDAGVSYPTILGVFVGLVFVFMALMLAF